LKLFSFKRHWAIAAVIVLLLFLLRPGASSLKSRIIFSISSGVGRPVDIGSVHIQLLPRPGFDLENLVIYDDVAFGAEPLLRADEVTAALRLTSLVRGRLEIARLDMTDPSLNLVRGPDGHWNLETLLQHAAHVPLAPTAKTRRESRPGFPYIEGSSGRINFMVGREKKPYALTSADFALWQESEDTWGVRLKAQPTRTDLNLNDTGILRVNGNWQRAASLRDTPLNFSVEWDRLQLGQLTKLLTGVDQGWRGGVQLALNLTGTPARLMIATDNTIQDFRRYDITSGDALRLAAHCEAQYRSMDRTFSGILCRAPVADGSISLKGVLGLPGSHKYDVAVNAERVPASALIAVARRVKKNIPDDLFAQGMLHGNVALKRDDERSKFRFDGRGEIENFSLAIAANKPEIAPETIPFMLTDRPTASRFTATARTFHKKFPGVPFGTGPQVVIGPFSTGIGKLTAGGWIDRGGYDFALTGESEIGKTLAAGRLVGLPILQTAATGDAQAELQIRGVWPDWTAGAQNFSGPQVTGTARLGNVRIPLRRAEAPAEILSANLQLLGTSVRVEKLNMKAANSAWTGSLEMARGCGTPAQCVIHFDLKSNQVALEDLSAWVNPGRKDRPWYRVLESNAAPPSFLASVRASGRIAVDRFEIRGLTATHVNGNLVLASGDFSLLDLRADVLGGKYAGEWKTDFRRSPAVSTSRGNLRDVALAELAQMMKDAWISGTASGTYEFAAEGNSEPEFWQSAEATLHFQGRHGELRHVSLEDAEPLNFADFSGLALLRARQIEVQEAILDTPSGVFQLNGVTSPTRELQFQLLPHAGGAEGYAIRGTLAEPHVSSRSHPEQARLKR
jgi:AsmA family/AsmA-like C-terminal region